MSASRSGALALLAAALLVCVASLRLHAPGPGGLAPAEPAAQRLEDEVTRQFGMELPVVWIVEGRAGTVWSPDVLARIQALTRAVFALPGVMAPDVVSLASPNVRDVRVTDGGFTPGYLMGEVPGDAGGIAALRARVDQDAMLRGNLVSLDGRAALVVANFRADVDRGSLATAALALRDRFRDDVIQVWTVGTPTLAMTGPASVRRRLPILAAVLIGLGLLAAAVCSVRRLVAALLAAVVIGCAAAAGAAWMHASVVWTVLAAGYAAGIAAVLGLRAAGPPPAVVALASAAALGIVAATGTPRLRPFFGALAVGVLLAPWAVSWARAALGVPPGGPSRRWPSHVVALVVVGAALGMARLDVALDSFGYGLRYLPSPARDDLVALAQHFPPPVSFAVRVRGTAEFVGLPGVLETFEQVTATVGRDPAVTQATSLADLVKRVHRAFNDDRAEFDRLPDEPGLVGRYVALAYSPGFRRFVDRPLANAAIWVSVAQADPGNLARVHRVLSETLAAHPIPHATTDPPVGDGMALLRASELATALARGAVGVLLLAGLFLLPSLGATAVAHALVVSGLSTAAAAGCLGWVGGALDLVTIPGLVAVGVAALASAAATGAARRAAIGAGAKVA